MILYTLYFILGLVVGSFLNVVIDRLKTGESIIRGRSYCPKCRAILKWYDLIPLLSFILLGGRCRYCKEKISWQYPIVEIATGFLFVFLTIRVYPELIELLFYLFLTSCFIVIFVFDLKYFIIPDKIIYPAIAISIMYHLSSIIYGQNYTSYIIHYTLYNYAGSAFVASAFFGALVLISRGRWMGLGDVKLAFLMGLILGWPEILLALFLSFLSGALVGLGLIAFGQKTFKSQVPFGPFLSASTIFSLFFGSQILDWYLRFLF